MTLGDRLQLSRGHPAGFDVLRLLLAAGVIVQHSVNVTAGQDAAVRLFHSPWRSLFEPILPMFFALSGFLVAGSLVRCRSLLGFGGLRVVRIVPALAVEVGLSAMILGPLVTDLPLAEYVRGELLRSYAFNILGMIHYRLPGVFLHNPDPQTVNAQLWTVPYELECYVALAALTVFGLTRRPALFLTGLATLQLVLVASLVRAPMPDLEVTAGGRTLVFCFLCGVGLFLMRHRITHRFDLFVLALAVTQVLIWVPGGNALIGLPVCYVTVVLGLTDPPKPRLFFAGDYSYGLYLYGFPIQQTLVHIFPAMPWFVNAPAALAVAFTLAWMSWWGVERRALRVRPALRRLEDGILDRLPSRLLPLVASRAPAIPS